MLWVVTYLGSVVGVYTSAVDSECVVRSLRARGCDGAVVTEARMKTRRWPTMEFKTNAAGTFSSRQWGTFKQGVKKNAL